MTDEEIRAYIKQECPHISDEHIDRHCELLGITLIEYKEQFERALAARRRDNPDYPKRKYDYN